MKTIKIKKHFYDDVIGGKVYRSRTIYSRKGRNKFDYRKYVVID